MLPTMGNSAAAAIDLISDEENITPNAAKRGGDVQKYKEKRVKTGENVHTVICLDDDSDDDSASSPSPPEAAASAAPVVPPLSTVTQSNEVKAVAPPAQWKTDGTGNDDKTDTDDEDVAIVGSTGPNALSDFPPSRANCVTYPLARDPVVYCDNCYCYVCDVEVSKCNMWQEHCRANHDEPKWRKLRQDYRDYGGPAPEAAPRVPTSHVATQPLGQGRTRWALTMRAPTVAARPSPMDSRPNLDEYSLAALLQTVTSVYPVEASPPPIFQTTLRHYQKQSLAFMLQAEQSQEKGGTTRGGWLADELGMGKSAVVLALVATNPMASCPSLQDIKLRLRAPDNSPKLKVKATVVMTSVSLMGQWEDECRKHCPGLLICRYHKSSRREISPEHLHSFDVIVSSSTFKWESWITDKFEFHRVVVDESHLFATAQASAKVGIAGQVSSYLKWCVTATPCTGSVSELSTQLRFLNSTGQYCHCESLRVALAAFATSSRNSPSKKQVFYALANELKKCMIRHTKLQIIQGEEALTLPSSSTTTVFLDMSPQEQQWFGHSARDVELMMFQGGNKFSIEQAFCLSMKQIPPGAPLTKIKTLVKDLRELRLVEPSFRVVVFTQYLTMYESCLQALRGENIELFEFAGSNAPRRRDDAIRQFQSQSFHKPAVFVITLGSGNVGITLTAASRVYLLEPSIDPSTHLQAAGRIHRLGQNKAVQCIKFVFRNSVESNIVDLHHEIAAGNISIADGHFPPEAVHILARGIGSRTHSE